MTFSFGKKHKRRAKSMSYMNRAGMYAGLAKNKAWKHKKKLLGAAVLGSAALYNKQRIVSGARDAKARGAGWFKNIFGTGAPAASFGRRRSRRGRRSSRRSHRRSSRRGRRSSRRGRRSSRRGRRSSRRGRRSSRRGRRSSRRGRRSSRRGRRSSGRRHRRSRRRSHKSKDEDEE
jgi:hypothetical protein